MSNDGKLFSIDKLRPTQQDIVMGYNGGRMGVSAVPGSGKTHTLSFLAADIILGGNLDLHQEVLVVTMSNSAVDNFTQRISRLIQSEGLMAGMGYRVRTLHGLAHDIVRERPSAVNLANDFSIIDEKEANLILESAANAWLRSNPGFFEDYFSEETDDTYRRWLEQNELPKLVKNLAQVTIKFAKDNELSADALARELAGLPAPLPLAELGCLIYKEYQRSLAYRGAVDFDDLIRLALAAMRADPKLVERLHEQWPYILEDEAQDSSRLQEQILSLLAGEDGNWVRVGDPNQAIYETFTTANPNHLINFIHAPGVLRKELPVSGRSTKSIIDLANHLIEWTRQYHPNHPAREALHLPLIIPSGPDDLQPNPEDNPNLIHFTPRKMTSEEEQEQVIKSLVRWQTAQNEKPEDARETLVVLDYRNERGAKLAEALRQAGVDPYELLHTSQSTRISAGELSDILRYLASPQSPFLLAKAFNTWVKRSGDEESSANVSIKKAAGALRSLKNVEDYLYPLPGQDWLENHQLQAQDGLAYELLCGFRPTIQRWHGAALLPIDQLVLTLAQDLFQEPVELAIAHKLAAVLKQASSNHPTWHLPNFSEELETISKNKRRFLGFSEDEGGFDPQKYKGRVVITTMHKAKGLEWDRVYLLSVNNYNFPSGLNYDSYFSEKHFIRGKLNLEAETLEQLKVALAKDEYTWYQEGQATLDARLDCIKERLRLLYVGITRARKSLVVTWNTGKRGDQQPAEPFLELLNYWEKQISEA